MKQLDMKTLKNFLELALERLEGDWILIGGAVLPLLGVEHRSTADIDIVGPPGSTQEQTLALLEIAADLGLPIEAVNQAGAYFLYRQEGFEEQLELISQGDRAAIYRPNATLYVLLKLSRLTESDLKDCQMMLSYARDHGEEVDQPRLEEAIASEHRNENAVTKETRLDALLRAVRNPSPNAE